MKTDIRTKHWRIDLKNTEYTIKLIKDFKRQYKVDRVIILKDMYYKEYVIIIYFQRPCSKVQRIDVTSEFEELI